MAEFILNRTDVLVRIRKLLCATTCKAETVAQKYFNGIIPSKCEIRQLEAITAMIEVLKCYTPPRAEVLAEGSFQLSGTNGTIWVTVNDVPITTAAVSFITNLAATLTAIETAIDGATTTPNYTASISGTTLTVTAVAGSGEKPNGYVIDSINTGDMDLTSVVNMADGVDGIVNDDNCFTLAKAEDMLDFLSKKTGIDLPTAGATYIDTVAEADRTENITDETGDYILEEAPAAGPAVNRITSEPVRFQ